MNDKEVNLKGQKFRLDLSVVSRGREQSLPHYPYPQDESQNNLFYQVIVFKTIFLIKLLFCPAKITHRRARGRFQTEN